MSTSIIGEAPKSVRASGDEDEDGDGGGPAEEASADDCKLQIRRSVVCVHCTAGRHLADDALIKMLEMRIK